MSADGFLGRWARRKSDVQQGKPIAEVLPTAAAQGPIETPIPADGAAVLVARQGLPAAPASAPEAVPAESTPLPTLHDVQQLTLDGDFKPFMAQGVTPEVKNAAMKKLFTDPHYNIMDGLDTYIEDYSISEPIPESMLRQMASAKFLNLFDEDTDKDKALKGHAPVQPQPTQPPLAEPSAALAETPDAETARNKAKSLEEIDADSSVPTATSAHEPPATQVAALSAEQPLEEHDAHHTNLRLQPDHAAEPQSSGHGAG